MKVLKRVVACLIAGIMALSMVSCSSNSGETKKTEDGKVNLVASFYPMYILTLNLAKDIDGVNVSCMADMNFGCIHDYTMKTDDLKNIEKATAFIENGFDLEPFNDKIEKAYPNMPIVKASDGINIKNFGYDKLIADDDDDDDSKDADKDSDKNDSGSDDDACCGGNGLNPHIWTDVSLYIEQVKSVNTQLKKIDTKNADKYQKNCDDYLNKLNTIKSDADKAKETIKGKHALVLDEVLPDLAHSLGVEYDFIETDHEQQSLSASQMKDILEDMKKDNTKAILITKTDDEGNAKTMADESGAEIIKLNSCMIGKDDIDEYVKDMTENIKLMSAIK